MRIRASVLKSMIAHARRDAPVEACGYLAGKDGLAEGAVPLRNVDASKEHFSFDPAEQFAAIRGIRAKQMKELAVYHSHPSSPARPSPEDIRLAYDPSISYVIVSFADGVPDVKSFRIKAGTVSPDDLLVIADEEALS